VLGAFHRVDTQREAHRRTGEHREVVVASRRPAGHRGEDPSRVDQVEVGIQQRRSGITGRVDTRDQAGRPAGGRFGRRGFGCGGFGCGGLLVAGRVEHLLRWQGPQPGHQLADHRTGDLAPSRDLGLGQPLADPPAGVGHLTFRQLGWATAPAHQPGRAPTTGLGAQPGDVLR